ncbi:hypothetical protein PYW07_003819 [Mythimna separata]|uniref:C-type lectin domain-containing protein n=1 Tax=Mythimna separata TaxID=271217 RepID=A0AAD8DUL8_MYTSE|nr:hypothetical protein PYW07_003819 [Mythimna separata]
MTISSCLSQVDACPVVTKMFSKALLVFLVVYVTSDFSHGQKEMKFFRRDYIYLEAVENFYKFHTIPQTWADAKRVCSQEGASLFYPENDKEVNAVIAIWNANHSNVAKITLGLSDILVEGLFETIDGRPISEVYHKWQPGQPDDEEKKQDCAVLTKKGDMDDDNCDTKYGFICKKSLQSLEWDYKCDLPEYTFNKNIGKCYKLHTNPLSWMDAYAVCRSEESHLAVITNRMEADYLAALTEPASRLRVGGNYLRGMFHIGFHNRLYKGRQTIKGIPLSAANAWWGQYEPEIDDREQCGAMFYTGRLTHLDCALKSFFICEHDAYVVNSTLSENEEEYQ